MSALGLAKLTQLSALVECPLVALGISKKHATALEVGEEKYAARKML